MSLTMTMTAQFRGSNTAASDLTSLNEDVAIAFSQAITNGTGSNQANQFWSDQRTLLASASETLDLSGSLVSSFGSTIVGTKLKGIIISAAAANTNNVIVGNNAANDLVWCFGAVTHTLVIPPGGCFAFYNPGNGFTITAGTGDLIKVANSAAGTSVTYNVAMVLVA
jgi:hypothetical protein